MVEYRPFVSRLYTKLAAQQPEAVAGMRVADWHAARQRRLQTKVGAMLGQQHQEMREEAQEVTSHQQWKERAPRPFGKRVEGYAAAKKAQEELFAGCRPDAQVMDLAFLAACPSACTADVPPAVRPCGHPLP